MKLVFKETWLFEQTVVISTPVMQGRATDGILPRSLRMERVVRVVGGRTRRSFSVAIARVDDGVDLWPRSTCCFILDSRCRTERRLPGLLLFSAKRGTVLGGTGTT